MPTPKPAVNSYDPRWFIWAIVFLVVSGVSLVSYIVFSDTGSADNSGVIVIQPQHKLLSDQKK